MYRPLSSNVALCITISPVVLFSETFSHLVELFSLLHDVYAFKFPPALEIALTVWCSLTVRDWGETRTSGGEMDSPGAPLFPGTPRGPGGVLLVPLNLGDPVVRILKVFPSFLADLSPQGVPSSRVDPVVLFFFEYRVFPAFLVYRTFPIFLVYRVFPAFLV